jgi:hypothetical protein
MGPDGVWDTVTFVLDDTFNFACIYAGIFCLMIIKDKLPLENPYDKYLPKTKKGKKCEDSKEKDRQKPT